MFLVALCLWHFFKVWLKIIFSSILIKMWLNIASLIAFFENATINSIFLMALYKVLLKIAIFSGIFFSIVQLK
jgi:hypothetical protein